MMGSTSVYCFRPRASDLLENIKSGFEREGLGDIAGRVIIDRDDTGLPETTYKTVGYRDRFKKFEGKIYLPKFVIQEGDYWRDINFEMDILKRVDWFSVNLNYICDLALDKKAFEDSEFILALADDKEQVIETRTAIKSLATWRIDKVFMTRQIIDIVPNPWIAHEICSKVADNLISKYDDKTVGYNLAFVIEELRKQIIKERDRLAEIIFRKLVTDKILWFFLIYDKGGYRLPSRIRIKNDTKRLVRADNSQLQKSLFEEVPEEGINQLEKSVAICLDEQQKLLWWYRNLSRQDYFVQGWKKNKIYPDFIFTKATYNDPNDYGKIFVIETKGLHLMNEDTAYKASVFDFCNNLGQQRDWRELNLEFAQMEIEFQVISEAEWKNKINQTLS